ncbi:carbohydrate ABC transporter permease [Candidatus Sumerlaeota bacterium]|nr:carbohydrate ABC transporter permease [Candidatus Sumerlaeota bacterium]
MASTARTLLGEHERRRGVTALGYRVMVIALFVLTLSTIYPLVWLVGNAFKSPHEYKATPLHIFPHESSPVALRSEDNHGPGKVQVTFEDLAAVEDREFDLEFITSTTVEFRERGEGARWIEVIEGDTDVPVAGMTLQFRGRFEAGDRFEVEIRTWHMENYAEAWGGVRFIRHSINTFVLMIAVLLLHLGVNALAAYALSRLPFPGSKFVMWLFLMTLMVPWFAIFIPLYLTVTELGLTVPLYGWPAVVIPAGFNAFFLILFKGFFDGLPGDLIDAARIDGAGELQTFWHVAVPLAKPIFAVITVFSLLATWNDFLWPYLVIAKENGEPLMVRLYNYEFTGAPTEAVLAALAMAMVPPIALFLLFQRQIAAGFTLSGLKG